MHKIALKCKLLHQIIEQTKQIKKKKKKIVNF